MISYEISLQDISMVITTNVTNFDISRIIIDEGNSYDIMYDELFPKVGLK